MRGDKWILWIDIASIFITSKGILNFFVGWPWITFQRILLLLFLELYKHFYWWISIENESILIRHVKYVDIVHDMRRCKWHDFPVCMECDFVFVCLFGIQKNLKWPKIALQWFSQANYFAGENGALWIFHDYTGTWSINNVFMWCGVVEMMCMKRSIEEIKVLFCTVNWLGWKLFIASDTGSVVIYSKSIEVRINVENNSCQCANECNVTSHYEMFATSIYAPSTDRHLNDNKIVKI